VIDALYLFLALVTPIKPQSSDSDYHVFVSLKLVLPPSSDIDVRRE
jgi:hypothetical protein